MSDLQIRMFGALQVRVADNAVHFRTDALRVLLAYLAAHQGRAQRRDTLAGLLAPDRPNNAALTYLRNRLTRLRHAIGDDIANPPYLTIDRKQIELRIVSNIWVDVSQFERLMREVEAHEHRQLAGCPTCLARLEEAVALVRGEFLEGLNFASETWEAWLLAQREHYRQQALEAMTLLRDAQAVRGEWRNVLEIAQRQLTLEAWLESAHRAIMLAHYHLGDRNAALAQYEQCEKLLYEELDVDPEPATLELHRQILDDDLEILGEGSGDNLPVQTGAFFGRSPQQAHLLNLLVNPTHRLITIVGTGGIGKTRLAIEVGRQVGLNFPDGVWFVALAAVQGGAEQIKIGIGEAVGLGQADRQLTGEQVIAILRDKQLLLILDNCETVLDGLAFLPQWLQRAPHIAILATSREPLNFQAESLVALDGLPMETAIDLFAERGQMARTGFDVTEENHPHIQQICQLVDGSPLGIALAAAWVRRRSLVQIIDSIDKSIDFLTTRMRDVDPRHRSMRAVFETSWQLLTGEEQAILAVLSVFPASFSADTAHAIANATLFDLDVLCEKSLLQQDQESERYSLHGLVRGFSADKLTDHTTINHAFADYFYQFAQTHHSDYAKLQPEWHNFSAAIEKAHALAAWRLVLDLVRTLDEPRYRQIRYADMRAGLAHALDAAIALQDEAARAQTLLRLGEIEMEQNAYESAEIHLADALNRFTRLEDGQGIANAIFFTGRIKSERGEEEAAFALFTKAQHIFAEEGNRTGVAECLNWIALYYLSHKGEPDRAEQQFKQSIDVQRTLPFSSTYRVALRFLARIASKHGAFDVAEQYLIEADAGTRRQNDAMGIVSILFERIVLCRRRKQFAQAVQFGNECLEKLQTLGSPRWEGLVMLQMALAYQATAQHAQAETFYAACLDIFEMLDNLSEQTFVHYYLFTLYAAMQRPEASERSKQQAIALNQTLKNDWLTEHLA